MKKSFYESIKLAVNLIKTKIFFPKARLIRFPFDIRGKKYIEYGRNFTTGTGCRIEAYKFFSDSPELIIGNNVQINDYVHLACGQSLIIEDDVQHDAAVKRIDPKTQREPLGRGVGLDRRADAEGGQEGEQGEDNREPLLPRPVLEDVHRPAAPVANERQLQIKLSCLLLQTLNYSFSSPAAFGAATGCVVNN